jgi:N-acetylneuraminate synthase/N,N'-diacetyllegionaminate synthase
MKIFGCDLDREVAVVAEIGVNHEGDVEAASRLLRLAAEAGAHAVKFQTFTPGHYTSSSDPARLARVTKFALDRDAHLRLAREAKELGVVMFSTAVSDDVVPFLAEQFPAIKIASGDLDFETVIRAAARTGRPVILSTGLGTIDEVHRAVGWLRDEIGATELRDRVVLMQCVSGYPAPVEEASVLGVPYLAEATGLRIGYSNHVIGPDACYAAVAHGACMLEVHFTDKKTGREFRDHALSFEPDDLRALMAVVPRIRASLGARGKERQASELVNLKAVRKGVVAARNLAAGHVLTRDDLSFARPQTEFAAGEIDSLVGKRLSRALRPGELVPRAGVTAS